MRAFAGQTITSPRRDLIFDLGSHRGDFTNFYLQKGFLVISVDANPHICEILNHRFQNEIVNGLCVVENRCVSDVGNKVPFYINSDCDLWSSVNLGDASRLHSQFSMRLIETVSIDELIVKYGCPYYIKIDLDSSSYSALEQLAGTHARPSFVSVHDQGTKVFEMLFRLGYTHFNIRSQVPDPHSGEPVVAQEGAYSKLNQNTSSVFLFARELKGWVPYSQIEETYRSMQRYDPDNWFDIHATFHPGSGLRGAHLHNFDKYGEAQHAL